MSVRVDVTYACRADGLPARRVLADWARAAAGARGMAELSIRLVDADEGARLNETYRHKPGPTNVLAFPFEAPPGLDLPLLGDVVVCVPVAAREAAAQGKAFEAHLAHLVVHGVLHLLGHDHQEPESAERMESVETAILAGLGFPDPYHEPVIP